MRDESPRVGRPRKGTQRKPKERPEREPVSQNSYPLVSEDDFHIQPDSLQIKPPVSPINVFIPPTSLSSDLSLDSVSELNQFDDNDNGMGGQEAICAFCNCGSEMAQILGQINRYYPSTDFDPFKFEEQLEAGESSSDKFNSISRESLDLSRQSDVLLKSDKRSVGRPPGKRKKRGKQQMLSADMCTFGTPFRPEISDVFDADGCIWSHHCCAAWSAGVCQTDSYDLENVDKAAYKAIGEQCSHCKRHGASTECQIQKCTKLYHYPCCASAGAFQDIKSMILLCPDHLDHAVRLAGSEACCVLCNKAGDISKQLFCTSCGRHYHGQCLDPPVYVSAIVRMGWQCPECKVCQGCRQPGDDEKMLFCDECDKGFHTYCLSPPMSSVPKTAWKCYSCRKCEDCGSNVPGSGPSCRWHFNYTVCDKCYQQRKKGAMPCCPMCGKAVRSSLGEFSRQCMKCGILVHCRCDKIVTSEDGNYFCPNCRHDNDEDSEMSSFMDPKEESNESIILSPMHSSNADLDAEFLGQRTVSIAEAEAISRTATGYLHQEPSPLLKQNEMEDLDLKGIDINFEEVMMETGLHGPLMQDLDDLKPDSSDSMNSPPHLSTSTFLGQLPSHEEKQLVRITPAAGKAGRGKKKMLPLRCRGRPSGTTGRGKKSKGHRASRPRSKTASTSGSNKENIQSGIVNAVDLSRKDDSDDPEGLHSTVVMVSTKDQFTLEQDICMCCGSFGKGSEGHLIACAQCGQCFHPYCVNLKINKVVMTKGWRCLDCTVCEGCGKNEDEAKLLLCDGCDISYHIYCLDPPLDEVPSDGWKCQWCVECVNCGATSPGVGCKWMSGYTQCGPCASDMACPMCNKTYLDHELVVKCMHCSRWLHAGCDGLASEDDAELAASYTYHCILCREKTGHYGIFSTSWTNVIERSIYSSADGKMTGVQSVIVTQTTTTILATGVANRRSRSASNSRSHRTPLSASGWNQRQPQEPVKTSAEGTFEVQLPGMKAKGRKEDNLESDNIVLTDDGLRQIKSLVVKASSRGHNRNKEKQAKMTSIDDCANERETKTSGQLTEISACSEDIGENRQPVCLPVDSKDLGLFAGSVDAGNYQRPDKDRRGSGRPSTDKRPELPQNKKLTDKRDDVMDFFGPTLLKVSKKKRQSEAKHGNDTQSSEDESNKADKYSGRAQAVHGYTGGLGSDSAAGKLVTPVTGSSGSSYQSRMKVGEMEEDIQRQDSLYKTLNMLVTGTEDADPRLMQRERELSEQKHQQSFSPSSMTASMRHPPKSGLPIQPNSLSQSMTQTGDLDLIGLTDLPHVDGHEVEEIFAGIEREMSVEGTPQSHGQSPMDASSSEYPKTGTGDFAKDQNRSVNSPSAFQPQSRLAVGTPQRPDSVLPSGFSDQQQHQQHQQHQQQRMGIQRQDFPAYDVYRNNQSFPLEQGVNYKAGKRPIQAQAGETDAFKVVFGEEPEIKAKTREGATSPKIDGQKQLKKWEQDEKLESLATISPVLYANIMHPELKTEYPEWPNRARAIARLWRKLPQSQREPFRLRARDNRVKQKDQGRKLGPFQKTTTSTPTPAEGPTNFYDSSSNVSSEKPGSNGLSSNTDASKNILFSQMAINGEQVPQSPSTSQPFSESVHTRVSVGEDSRYGDHTLDKRLIESKNMLHPTSSSLPAPSVLSPSSQFSLQQNSVGSFARSLSRGSSKPPSLPDMAGHDVEFSGLAATPTTPVFASSPFQPSSFSVNSMSSPGQISPSVPVAVGEKRKLKKSSKPSKETEQEKEEKKRRLAVEQEKERQWKLLQQQRLREQQLQQQTPAIQQVMMVKEQMRKDSKPVRKSEIVFAADHGQTGNEIRSNLLPHVEPSALTQSAASKDTHIVNQILETLPVNQSSKQGVLDSSNTITTPSSYTSHTDYQKSNLQHSPHITAAQGDFPESSLSPQGSRSTQFGFNSGRSQHGVELDSLLKINDSDLIKMGTSRVVPTDVSNISSAVEVNNMPTVYVSKALTQLQMSTGGGNEGAISKEALPYVTDTSSTGAALQQHSMTPAFSAQSLGANGQAIVFASESSNLEKTVVGTESQAAKALSGFLLDSHSAVVQSGGNENFDKQHASGVGQQQQQQQQALLFQQQQFMAAQQQYIQWQLQQRNPELFQSMTTPIQFPSYPDKDLPEVDSEEQHQERIRFLYRQRQMQKQQVVQIQQQLHQQQVYTSPQMVTGSSARPQMDQTQQYFVQQLMQYQQQIPEALQQQFLVEYSRQMQQRGDVSQSALQYDKFLAELAQRYGYPMAQTNAQTMSVMQHGVSWPSSSSSTFHPNLQQIIAYSGITEEKLKELTPQQLYQLQMQHTLIMQMAAGGLYPTQAATVRQQSTATSASRKGGTSTIQAKKSRDIRKTTAQDKMPKTEALIKSPVPDEKVPGIDGSQLLVPEVSNRNLKPAVSSQDTGTVPQQTEKLFSPVMQTAVSLSRSSPLAPASQVPNFPIGNLSDASLGGKETIHDADQMKVKSQDPLGLEGSAKDHANQSIKEQSSSSSSEMSKNLPVHTSTNAEFFPVSSSSDTSSKVTSNICTDGVHCGTDSESEDAPVRSETVNSIPKSVLSTGPGRKPKTTTDDCLSSSGNKSSTCTDGVHCGTDSDNDDDDDDDDGGGGNVLKTKEEGRLASSTAMGHCGTDSKAEEDHKGPITRQPCSDGIHCGTDSESETEKPKKKNVCTDGIHCGTDSEDEGNGATILKGNSAAKDDNRDLKSRDSVRKVCSDGIHCGTDSEEEEDDRHVKKLSGKETKKMTNIDQPSVKPVAQQRPLVVVCRQGSTVSTPQLQNTQAGSSLLHSTKSSDITAVNDSSHTLEVIQEGDVTQNTFNAIGNMNRNLELSHQASKPMNVLSQSTAPLIKPQLENQKQELSDIASIAQGTTVEKNVEPKLGSNSAHPSRQDINEQNISAITSQNISTPNELLSQSLPTHAAASQMQSPKGIPSASTPVSQIKPPNISVGITPQDSEARFQLLAQPQPQPQPQLFSPKPTTQSSTSQQVDIQSTQKQKSKVAGNLPTSPQYQQLFMHQHQLLIMQFQQYQYQLQAQYQQLSQQQMSPQQQFLLQQQYHQQMMLLQRQFVQQQAQLQSMASAGMQFTEQELNIMYQQQMVAQQAYKQWVATLSLDQQGQLHARMQANMQQIQQGMTAMMQNIIKNSTENSKDKPKKQRGRRARKSKSDLGDPAVTEPRTPTHPQTPASLPDASQPSTPNKDTEFDARRKSTVPTVPPLTSSGASAQLPAYPTHQATAFGQTAATIATSLSAQLAVESTKPTNVQSQISPFVSVASQDPIKSISYATDRKSQPSYVPAAFVGKEQRILPSNRQDWPPVQSTAASQLSGQQSIQASQSQAPRVDIVPEGSNPFSDVYQEMEKKAKAPGIVPISQAGQPSHLSLPNQNQLPDPWKNAPNRSEQLHSRPTQQQMHSTSALFYPSSSPGHSVGEGMTLHQVRRETPLLSQNQTLLSPTASQSHSLTFTSQSAHSSGQAALVTLSTTVINNSSELTAVNSAETLLVPSNLQQHHWMQTTSVISQSISSISNTPPQQMHTHGLEGHKTTSIMYPPQNGPSGSNSQQPLYPPHLQERAVVANDGQTRNIVSGNQSQYPPTYSHKPQPSAVSTLQGEANNTSLVANGDPSLKDNAKVVQKRQKGSSSSHMPSGNVDFSLLSPEEQRKFILERKREDFERRRRLLEEQRKLKDQENQKVITKKVDKKAPKAKQQRRLKNVREKETAEKPTLQTLLVLEDKSMKLPLCEPEVHLLYPLVQPFGSGYLNGDKLLFGAFGSATLQGEFDHYSQFPSPNPPVTSSNPPTPPSSLPPSPGTINQSLRDSLQMIPTEGIFDDMPHKSDVKRTSRVFEHSAGKEDDKQKDSKDNVLVTLVMTENDRRVPNDRVSYVTDVLGIAKPETIQIVDESSDPLGRNGSAIERPQATSVGRERDVHYTCLDDVRPRNGVDNKGPFCKHCDISIHGSGYVQCKSDSIQNPSAAIITVDNSSFEKVNITPGTQLLNAFCSELCLSSYYSISKSKRTSDVLNQQEQFADDSGQFIDPVRSVIPVSTGEPTNSNSFESSSELHGIRGNLQTSSPLLGLAKRKVHDDTELDKKRSRPGIWKRWKILFTSKRVKKDTAKLSVAELLERFDSTLKPKDATEDTRECMLCGDFGDGQSEGTARLINYDVNIWVHLNCALWSLEVYETLNGALHNVQKAYERGIQTICVFCQKKGATVTCARVIGSQMRRCEMNYHFSCAIKANCVFFKDKTVLCPQHKNYGSLDQRLPSYAVYRKVYINRDITKQLASVLQLNNEKEQKAFTIRIGSLIFHELGQLLPHQLQKFHSKDAIYPVGFRTTRFYWSRDKIGKRCPYLCSVEERNGSPHFVVSVNGSGKLQGEFTGSTPKDVWSCIFEPVRKLREEAKLVKIFPEFVTGEDLYGLSDPSIQRIIESLPGVDTIHDYSFRFGRTPIIMAELPLAVNPTGCIRSESTRNVHLNRPVSLRTASSSPSDRIERGDSIFDDSSQGSLLRNSWAVSKTAQYRRMKSEWKSYVLLSKSRIQGLGLFAVRDIEPNTMIIEYIGSLIRNEVANKRERIYENSNRGVYMFRVDSDTVIDATLTGGPARYINHSCDPNCVAEVVIIEKMPKIIIISNRKLEKGEELTYDYKFEFEDDQHKIACLCGAVNCRKWMN